MNQQRISVLITRPDEGLGAARRLLPEFDVCPCPTINACEVRHSPKLDELFRLLPTFDFAIFTSQIAVAKTVGYLRDLGVGLEELHSMCVGAVGPMTAQALRDFGVESDVIPNKYTAQALADLFPIMHTHAPMVLFPRGNLSSKVLQDELTRKGYEVASPVIYRTMPRKHLEAEARQRIARERVERIAFTSPSSVIALKSILGDGDFQKLARTAAVAAIGPITSAACAEEGLHVSIQPEGYTIGELAVAIRGYFANPRNRQSDRGVRIR